MDVYIDDMLVKSKKGNSHLTDLREAFEVLQRYRIKLNLVKCTFGVSSGKFLGFMVNQRGIEANLEKIRAVLDMEPPKNMKQLQCLNGKIVALNRFMSRSTDKCLPFFKVLKTKGQFERTPECQVAFEQLKTYLSTTHLLAKPMQEDQLFLYLAVSEGAVSSALVKQEKGCQSPVYYMSKAMTDAEIRYPMIEKLAFALVTTAQRLGPYFQAHFVTVLTNFPLRQVFQKPETSGKLMKWALELSEYDLILKPRTAIKGQAVADLIAELTPPAARSLGAQEP